MVATLVPEPDAAASLLTRVLHELDWPEPEAEVADALVIARTIRGLTFVANAGDEIVGALFASLEQGGRAAFVRWIVVDAAHRRNGVGHGLVDALEQTPGIGRILGLVDRNDPIALQFWRSRGWTPVHQRPRRELMGVDLPRPTERPT